jgi:hypothetical protein
VRWWRVPRPTADWALDSGRGVTVVATYGDETETTRARKTLGDALEVSNYF